MSTQQSGLVSGNSQNRAGGDTPRSRSRFQLSYSQFQTERFAEYVPFHVMEGVSGDVLPLQSNHEVQTYTLKSPILQSLSKKKDYFVVPMQAILPLNWEKFYTNPNIGQDVPSDCGLGVVDFWKKIGALFTLSWNKFSTDLADANVLNATKIDELLHFLLFFEQFYSCGSLMETLGTSGHNNIRCTYDGKSVMFDDIFDLFFQTIANFSVSGSIAFTLGGDNYEIVAVPDDFRLSALTITPREALELMRDDFTFSVVQLNGATASITAFMTAITGIKALVAFTPYLSDAPLNLGRLWAYQLVVSHFYSNDHVDFIYSAELFREYINQLCTRPNANYLTNAVFSVNGLTYRYDALSAYYFGIVISSFSTTDGIFAFNSSLTIRPDTLAEAYAYFVALFGFKRSLRFMDYFTGSRSLPLAVGDHEVNVNSSNKVDIVELSKASMMTRFLQAVNRSGRKFSAYMEELFGRSVAYDYHNPMYLAHTSDLVGAQETENTGAAQVSAQIAVTSRLRATSARHAFEFRPDRDCIVIGITYYDLPRVYTRATERQNFIVDRFDMFNPFMQFIGDQPIFEAEIGTDTPDVSKNFSYTNRHMEYKQRFNQANGGFCVPSTQLDNWIFPADTLRRRRFHNISPSFIRSFNSEIDPFYQSLTGYSLGTYFHFIVRYDNRMDASRPMAYQPALNV